MTETASTDPTSTPPDPPPVDTTTSSAILDGTPKCEPPENHQNTSDAVEEPALTDLPASNGDDTSQNQDVTKQHQEPNGNTIKESTPDHPPQSNGHHDESPTDPDERPAKRRRTRESTPPPNAQRKPKPISPPWKKVQAEGPSSFSEGGRRKSGRINTVPLELQSGDKRITRRAVHAQQNSPPSKGAAASASGHATRQASAQQQATTSPANGTARRASSSAASSKASSAKTMGPPHPPSRHSRRSTAAASEPRPGSSSRAQHPSPAHASPSRTQPSRSNRSQRALRDTSAAASNRSGGSSRRGDSKLEMPTRTTPRIRLRTRTLTIPIVHPDQAKVRPRLASSFEEYYEKSIDIPVEEGGWMASEDGPRMTDEMAADEAAMITRIEKETEPGGILTAPRCTVFEPEQAEEPPRQYARQDHMVKAMANFRRLLAQEQQRHRAAAKKLAEACRDEWIRRQPKSAEQIEAEARAVWMSRYRLVVRAILGTWDNVRAEINRRRLEEWEAEEQKRVKAALQEAVALSEQKLQARRTHLDSDALSDEELGDLDDEGEADDADLDSNFDLDEDESGSGDDDDDDDESNMSSSEDEDEDDEKQNASPDAADEGLTQAQLRKKYSNLPELAKSNNDVVEATDDTPSAAPATDKETQDEGDTSDESVDMDDDLGSSDMDTDDDDDDADGSDGDEESSDDEDDQGGGGLLGMLFGKSELKKLKDENTDVAVKVEEGIEKDGTALTNGDVEMVGVSETKGAEPSAGEASRENNDVAPEINGISGVNGINGINGINGHKEGREESSDQTDTAAATKPKDQPEDTDVSMVDVLAGTSSEQDIHETEASVASEKDVRGVEVSVLPAEEVKDTPSPETDAVTTALSPGRSQSPRTSDTKPSDLDTPMSTDLVSAPKGASESRSVSPAPINPSTAPKTEIPFLLRGTLREYQHYGLDWLAGLYSNNTNGILADEMGLGKTIQTIALLAHLACHHEIWGPHLVIVPTSVILNWEMEFKKWCPAFKILTYYGSQDERKRKRAGWNNNDLWNVCITSYQIVVQDQQVFKRRKWHYMILDEAHNIKNFKSQRWQSLLGFNTHSRLLLTGTPLQNNLTELWSLLFFLMPPENGTGGFADLQEFHDWFHKPESQILESGREQMDEEARAIISKLHKVLRPYLLRRLKADVEKQMPGKYEHVEMCRLSKRQRELYDGFLSRSDTRETLSSGNYLSIINCLMQLRKVCNHPDLFVDRPIMTSFRMLKSVPAAYEAATDQAIRHRFLGADARSVVSLSFLNLIPAEHEGLSAISALRINQLATNRVLADLKEAQRARLPHPYPDLDATTVQSNLAYLENAVRWKRFEELQHCAYLNALRRQQKPIYGKGLIDMLTLKLEDRPFKPKPKVPAKIMEWFENDSFLLHNLVQPLERRAGSMEMLITKFACVTPAVVTRDMTQILLGRRGVETFEEWDLKLSAPIKTLPFVKPQPPRDPWHESRMRLSIQFPDKRLLQYDCGKLQALDRLLRRLQTGGHRALIFTQMTKVLDILEQFLNIHGHKYLRLDGATKIEQRQILTDRFNHDNRILCFILSTRSGGLGINLTGADTVIFYDQDWNPAMDKQCQDRCHRIGQTRDVHIYRLISEHTIEANILRKASQKQMLDDVVIQEGEFTTDYFNKLSVRDALGGEDGAAAMGLYSEVDAAANAAMDRVLGGVETVDQRTAGRVLEQAEDREDVAAARVAEKETQQDEADFTEKPSGTTSGVSSVRQGSPHGETGRADSGTPLGRSGLGLFAESVDDTAAAPAATEAIEYNAWGKRMLTIDDYMLGWMKEQLKGTVLELPKDKKKSKKKKGKDTRKR